MIESRIKDPRMVIIVWERVIVSTTTAIDLKSKEREKRDFFLFFIEYYYKTVTILVSPLRHFRSHVLTISFSLLNGSQFHNHRD